MGIPGQYVFILMLAIGAAILSAAQAWALGGTPPRRGRYALAWVLGAASLALPVLVVFGAASGQMPRAVMRVVVVLAALTAGFALWIGARAGATAAQSSSFGQRMLRLLPLQVFVLALLGALDGCALFVVGLGRIH